MSTQTSKAAEAAFRKSDKEAAMSEYNKQQMAVREKIARLQVLRLAREAAERVAAALADKEKAAAKKPAVRRRKTASVKDVVLT
jgi:hypothetical protein